MFCGALLLLLASSCVFTPKKPEDKLVLTPTSFAKLNGWQDDRLSEALPVFLKSCAKPPAANSSQLAKEWAVTPARWRQLCAKAEQLQGKGDAEIRRFFEANFTPFIVSNHAKEEGLFTGYHEINLKGSLVKTTTYNEPLYRMPPTPYNKPFYSRKEIDAGALAGKNLEMLYVDDPVKAFFLHIQGSGRVQLEDGRVIRVGYADQNGHPYVAIGRCLIERGELEKKNISARAIKEWLYAHKEQAGGIMAMNPSYVFFREITGEGPIGAEGVPLTPERSLAVDKRFLPYGVPVWLETSYPDTPRVKSAPFRKLLIAQDTGGAIRGPVRGDVFFGSDARAEMLAEYMKNTGRYMVLLPNTSILQPIATR